MKTKLSDIKIGIIDENWLLSFLKTSFAKPEENITALKILAKLGVSIHDQTLQLKNKDIIREISSLLKVLNEKQLLEIKDNLHDTLGIKEIAYKLKSAG